MKKILLIISLLAIPMGLLADNVPADEALSMANQFFYPSGIAPASSLKLIWDGEDVLTKSSAAPAFYIFAKDGGGFVMISGDDALPAVLAYSDSADFPMENMPEHVAAWFAQIRKYIQTGRSKGYASTGYVHPSWQKGIVAEASPVVTMTTANWGQGYPYNAANNKGYLTGCVATAMAEVFQYIKYPSKGTGTIPAYRTSSYGYSIPENKLGEEYLWDKMPYSSYNSSWTEENIEQVARLMYDCGTMVQMDFSTGSSGAFSEDVVTAIIQYMGIDKSAYYMNAYYYSSEEWTSKLRAALDEGRPLYYSAVDESGNGGHAFVLDGYDTDGDFHINFGWNGSYNGYYTFPYFEGSGYVFSEYHGTVFNFKPDEGGKAEKILAFEQYYTSDTGLGAYKADQSGSFTIPTKKFISGKEYLVVMDGIVYNSGSDYFEGVLTMARENSEGVLQELCKEYEAIEAQPFYGESDFELHMAFNEINEGDVAKVYFKGGDWSETLSDWKPVLCEKDEEGFRGEIALILDEGALSDETSVKYNVEDKVINITTLSDATFTFVTSSGTEVKTGVTSSAGKIDIDTKVLQPGKYTLTLKSGVLTKTLVFNIGK